ncbi:hypothetical protein GCM10023183_17100 [Nibribacter koreensis]|uniref:Uncharacterized protein n=2 Tax=Nibribacter koreensis TaxID=1084519 RepID=A0ABP8FHL9_9BACT
MNQDGSWADTIWVSYKQGNYHTSKNTTPRSSAIYKPEANKIYSLQEGEHAGICTVTDASQDLAYAGAGKKRIVQKIDTAVTVNGVACTLIRVKLEDQIIDYYYNPGHLQVNPALFSQHKYEGLADFLKMSKALPLKMEKTINGMFTVTMTLVSTQAVAIDEGIFTIPVLAPDPSLNLIKVANQEVMRIKR